MTISAKAIERLQIVLGGDRNRDSIADEIISAVEGILVEAVADYVAPLGSTTNIPTVSVTLSTSDTYTDAAVKTAIDAGCNAVRTAAETRLDAIEAKLDAVLAGQVAAGQMADS